MSSAKLCWITEHCTIFQFSFNGNFEPLNPLMVTAYGFSLYLDNTYHQHKIGVNDTLASINIYVNNLFPLIVQFEFYTTLYQ